MIQEEEEEKKVVYDQERLEIDPNRYQQQVIDDNNFINADQELAQLVKRRFNDTVYSKTYKNVPAAALVHGCFAHRRQSDQMTFSEQMSEFMMKNDPKINTITVRIEPF